MSSKRRYSQSTYMPSSQNTTVSV